MNLQTALLRLLIFPGLLFAVPAGWLFLWIERKAVARAQRRVGPPFPQPFFDFMKLMGKTLPERPGATGVLLKLWPVLSVASLTGVLALLPIFAGSGGFAGDLVLLLVLLELPSICLIAAGFSSRSLFGEIGAAREAVLSVAYNLVFLLAAVAIGASQHSFRLDELCRFPGMPLRWVGILGLLVCIPARLHVNPFSAPDAEQEIYAGPVTEYAGPELALWELSHGLEWVAMTGLVACFGLLAAVMSARESGVGRDVDTSLFDLAVFNLNYPGTWYLNAGAVQGRTKRSAHPSLVPSQLYRTADGWIFVMCNKEKFWPLLCAELGRPEWAQDARFLSFGDRLRNKEALNALLESEFTKQGTKTWLQQLSGKLPVAPVNDVGEALENPFVAERGGIAEFAYPDGRKARLVASPIRLSDAELPRRAAPALGADTDALLAELGYSAERIARLRAEGAVG